MSHEIRTPMTAIMGMLKLLEKSNLSAAQVDDVETIHDSSEALLTIVDQILQYSKMESSDITVESIAFNPRRLVRGATTLLRSAAMTKALELSVDVDPSVPDQIEGDPDKIRQILTNLLSNALRFTDKGSVHVTARGEYAPKANLIITVADTGVGISPDAQEKVFEPFSQADASITRRFGGTGMGLAICKALVDAMEGQISFESQVKQGTVFTVVLPMKLQAPGSSTSGDPAWRIAVVEDLEINRNIAIGLLESEGHIVTGFATGQEAISAASQTHYDLALVDLHMPDMNGYQVSHALRAQTPDLAIVVLTASGTHIDSRLRDSSSIDQILHKPLDYRRLRATMADLRHKWGAEGRTLDKSEHRVSATSPSGHPNEPQDLELDEYVVRSHIDRFGLRKTTDLYQTAWSSISAIVDTCLDCVEQEDWKALSDAAHQLSGASSSYGLPTLHNLGQQINDHLQRRRRDSVRSLVNRLEEKLRAAMAAFQTALDTHTKSTEMANDSGAKSNQ